MATQDPTDEPIKIEYRPDGKIPMGIWLVWTGFAAWAIYYSVKYAIPDLVIWLRET